jgi:hypothetical protein
MAYGDSSLGRAKLLLLLSIGGMAQLWRTTPLACTLADICRITNRCSRSIVSILHVGDARRRLGSIATRRSRRTNNTFSQNSRIAHSFRNDAAQARFHTHRTCQSLEHDALPFVNCALHTNTTKVSAFLVDRHSSTQYNFKYYTTQATADSSQ